MKWEQLITNKRLGQEYNHDVRKDDRSEFKRDYDRLIFSAPFRRMQNKTQVFPLPGSIFVHNRLTHSLEVASVGMSLGNDVARELVLKHPQLQGSSIEDIGVIVSAACLAHDMGNPPFGHSGESAIQSYFSEGAGASLEPLLSKQVWQDITHFEGNANAFRLLTHRFNGRREGGFAMTYTTLASIVKYPCQSYGAGKKGKFGFFASEENTYCKIANELGLMKTSASNEPLRYARHPLVYLVEAADDICYEIMDIEDSHKLKILTFEETQQLLLSFFDDEEKVGMLNRIKQEGITDKNEMVVYLRGCLIDHIEPLAQQAYKACSKLSYEKIYNSKPVLDVELSGYKIIQTLIDTFVNAVKEPNHFYSKQLIKHFSSQYEVTHSDLNVRVMAVLDYISGMTDVYALDLYQKINGISLPVV